MNSEELLKKINELCTDAQKDRLYPEDLQANMEGGWGGNGDDAFYGGYAEGKADLGGQIHSLFEEFVSKSKQGTNKDLLDLARNIARGVDVDVESVQRLVEEIDK